jgi:hypothetical protein
MKDQSEAPAPPNTEDIPEEENDGIAKQPIRHNKRPQRASTSKPPETATYEETPTVSQEHEPEEEVENQETAKEMRETQGTDKVSLWQDRPETEKDITPGLKLFKEFPGHGSFEGTITGINTHEADEENQSSSRITYIVTYEDGDSEELYAEEVRPLANAHKTTFGSSPGEEAVALASDANRSTRDKPVMAADVIPPPNYKAAMKSDLAEEWAEAIRKELQGMIDFGVWEVVPRTEMRGHRPISTVYVFKAKPNADGTLERLKARICARGFLQKYGTDFLQTFAPVARLSTIRLQVAISAQLDLKMTHLDFKSAFLQGDLDVPLFMEQPEGLKELMASKGESIGEDCVLRLKKGIYGLKQAGRIWYKSMASGLMDLGFTRSPSDTCLFYILNEDKSDIIIITTWVDDCIVSYNNEETWKCMLARICDKFTLGTGTDFEWCLGMAVHRDTQTGTICLHQSLYVQNLLKRFHMEDCNSISTPADPSVTLSRDMSPTDPLEIKAMETTPYRSLLGALLHLANFTRPDIALAVNICSRYANCYGPEHWKALKRILRYLKGTMDPSSNLSPGLSYRRMDTNDLAVTGFVDADYARCPDTRKSTTGYIFMCCGGPLSWESTKQKIVATSTAEAEYVALALAVKEAIWLRKLFHDLELTVPIIPLHEDNEACIKIAENPVFHRRTKHIDIRFHFTREHLELGHITIPHISTKDQLADILTKPLPRPSFESFSQILVKWTTERPWRRSPLAAYAFMLHRPLKKRRGFDSDLGVRTPVGVPLDSPEESKSSDHRSSLECDEAISDPLVCSRPHCHAPRSLQEHRDQGGNYQREDFCSRACSALCGVSTLTCLNPSCSKHRATRTAYASDLMHHYDFCSSDCRRSHQELRNSMKSPVLSSVGAESDLRFNKPVPGPPRQARAGPSFDDYQARPALQLSPPIDPRYPWITDRKLLDVIDSERWDQNPGLMTCLEEQWICTAQELENLSVADLLAIPWSRSDMCSFLLLVAQVVDESYDRDTPLSGSTAPPSADVLTQTRDLSTEEIIDLFPYGSGKYVTHLPIDESWMDHHQKWYESVPLCRTCIKGGSQYNDPCAAIFMEATPTRSIVIFADQCTMCRGLYDGLQGLDRTEISEPEDCGYHALPQGAEYWSKDSDITPPPIKEGFVWQRPFFVDGKLRFPDGQAAADAAAIALAASEAAMKLSTVAIMYGMIDSQPTATGPPP